MAKAGSTRFDGRTTFYSNVFSRLTAPLRCCRRHPPRLRRYAFYISG
jgi:hypothetical protein